MSGHVWRNRGYPVILDGSAEEVRAYLDESEFDLASMRSKNRESIYLDGIEDVKAGVLRFTDELLDKVKTAFGVSLAKEVTYEASEKTAEFLISKVIEPYQS